MTQKLVRVMLAVAGLLIVSQPTSASTITLTLGFEFSGGQAPSGAPTVTLDDHGGTGLITFTIDTNPLSGTEFISEFDFNLDPTINPTTLTVGNFIGVTPSVTQGTNCCKADGDGYFDIGLGYPTSNSGSQLGPDVIASFDVTLPGLTIADFGFKSENSAGNGSWYLAAHVQNTTGAGDTSGSGWVGPQITTFPTTRSITEAPEPVTLVMFGTGLVGLAARLRRKRQ